MGGNDFCGLECNPYPPKIYSNPTLDESNKEELWHRELFKVFLEMCTLRDFQLVLCADVSDRVGECAIQVLKQAVARERLNRPLLEALVICSLRGSTNMWTTYERRIERARVRSTMVQ